MVGQGGDPAQVQDSEELRHHGRGGFFSRGENATSRTGKARQGGQERGPKQKVFDQVSEVEFLRAKNIRQRLVIPRKVFSYRFPRILFLLPGPSQPS